MRRLTALAAALALGTALAACSVQEDGQVATHVMTESERTVVEIAVR